MGLQGKPLAVDTEQIIYPNNRPMAVGRLLSYSDNNYRYKQSETDYVIYFAPLPPLFIKPLLSKGVYSDNGVIKPP